MGAMLPLDRQEAYRGRYSALKPGWRSSGMRLEALVRAVAGPDVSVLDIGSGRGGILELIGSEVRLAVGVDPDLTSLKERRARVPAAQAWGDRLPLRDATFDVALAIWVLEHLAEPQALFADVARVLRPGGRLIFLTPNRRHPLIVANRLSHWMPRLQRKLVPAIYGRAAEDTFSVWYRANAAEDLARLAAAAGLSLERLDVIADPTYLAFNDAAFAISRWLEACLPTQWGVHLLGVASKPSS